MQNNETISALKIFHFLIEYWFIFCIYVYSLTFHIQRNAPLTYLCCMFWGADQLYDMHVGGGNKTLLIDLHKRPYLNRSEVSHICMTYILVPCLLYQVHILHTGYVHSCDDIWSTNINNPIVFLDISPIMFYISVKHCLNVHLHLHTLTCFTINYHVNNDTPFVF